MNISPHTNLSIAHLSDLLSLDLYYVLFFNVVIQSGSIQMLVMHGLQFLDLKKLAK